MVSTALISLLLCVQPICTPQQFKTSLHSVLTNEREIIASAIFDEYLEQVQTLSYDVTPSRISPIQQLNQRFQLSKQADTLFDDLLASLSVLHNASSWRQGIANLRRTVLLEARLADNPWPATIWFDLPGAISIQKSDLIRSIDAFLIANIDSDRKDRFDALQSRLAGDIETCKSIEKRAMSRWGEYTKLIDSFVSAELRSEIYPQLDQGQQVLDTASWIAINIQSETVNKTVQNQFAIWDALHNKLNNDIIALVQRARLELGFDPWSRGCGFPTNSTALNIKNNLLRQSAEIIELDRSTVHAMLQQLTPEQLQLFNDG